MYQIKVNGILLPTIYWSLREAMNACAVENNVAVPYLQKLSVYKGKITMLKEFENWLLKQNYKPTTALDYMGRIERLCRKEQFTLSHLVENITSILPEYERNGTKSSYGKRSHTSVRQALKRLQMFLVAENLVESAK